jgi:ribonuclease HI
MAQPQTAIPAAMPKTDFPRASPVPNNTVAGAKRKRGPTEQKFYAVAKGRRPGVYYTWEECLDEVRGQKGASCMDHHLDDLVMN